MRMVKETMLQLMDERTGATGMVVVRGLPEGGV